MNRKTAFTLNELLIVIAIIVLLIALALPAFNAITGSRSIESAQNQVSAFIGQARVEAIGIQQMRGVMFFLDMDTDRINMAMVREAFTTSPGGNTIHFLELVPDRDFVTLPIGVGLQTIDDPMSPYFVANDRYIGFNNPETPAANAGINQHRVLYGGVILFDGYGKLANDRYAFHCAANATAQNITASGLHITGPTSTSLTPLGSLLRNGNVTDTGVGTAHDFTAFSYTAGYTFAGQYGVILYDREAFANAPVTGGTSAPGTGREEDWQIDHGTALGSTPTNGNGTSYPEADREAWLQANATHLLINRYNGTLVKGE